MSDECDLCLLGLIFLSSLLTGISGEDETHVFISSGENVRLPCNNDDLHDCKSITWIYRRHSHSSGDELIVKGKKNKLRESHERLSLGSDCSLNINNITKQDCGSYVCRQHENEEQDINDALVYLHVLQVSSSSSSSSQTEISTDSVTLFCQLFSYYNGDSCEEFSHFEGIDLFWVNQAGVKLKRSDSRYHIVLSSDHCIISLPTTLLNEDLNRDWRCEVTHRNQVKASVTITVKRSAPDSTQIPVSSSPSEKRSSRTTAAPTRDEADSTTAVTNSQDPSTNTTQTSAQTVTVISVSAAALAAFLSAVLWLICRKRADNKRGSDESAVKGENEHKETHEKINMSIPAAARDNEEKDDVTYSEVSSSGKKPVKSLNDHNDTVTYAAIR